MAGKRSATSELNHDNWDQEEDVEVQGSFQKASDETIKTRVIRTAKRRNPIRTEEDEKKSAFASFTGFSTTKSSNADFSFLSKSDSVPKTNGIDNNVSKPNSIFNFNSKTSSSTNIFGAPPTASTVRANIFGSSSTSNSIVPNTSTIANKSERFCSKLKGLNESVSKWITKKVEENPLISLQPIFKDYEKYLDEIDKEESTEAKDQKTDKAETKTPIPSFNFTPSADKNNLAIPDSTTEKTTEIPSTVPTFSFGVPSTSSSASTKTTFSFGSTNNVSAVSKPFLSLSSSSSGTTPTFSFGSSTTKAASNISSPLLAGFTFGNSKKSDESEKPNTASNADNDNEDEPPKVEFQPVVEKDHLYTIRCKVFVKKGDNFGDRGVGNLYLKTIENSEKVQLIVRADTNLGNLILNFILSDNVPTKRMGKKDVMLVAVPTPDVKPPPVPLLIRVKTPEEADKLLEVLEKHKK